MSKKVINFNLEEAKEDKCQYNLIFSIIKCDLNIVRSNKLQTYHDIYCGAWIGAPLQESPTEREKEILQLQHNLGCLIKLIIVICYIYMKMVYEYYRYFHLR
jgi:hypothetical protein